LKLLGSESPVGWGGHKPLSGPMERHLPLLDVTYAQ
jgi:hypothetical protein